jgi:hypothetical protein
MILLCQAMPLFGGAESWKSRAIAEKKRVLAGISGGTGEYG